MKQNNHNPIQRRKEMRIWQPICAAEQEQNTLLQKN